MHKVFLSLQTPQSDNCSLLKKFVHILKTNDFSIRKQSDYYLIQDKNKIFYHNQALILNTNLGLNEFKQLISSHQKFIDPNSMQLELEIVCFQATNDPKPVQLPSKHNLEHYIAFQEIDPNFLMQKAHIPVQKLKPLVDRINTNTIQKMLNLFIIILIGLLFFNSKFAKAVNHSNIQFNVEIADTVQARKIGLSKHLELKNNQGMLFVYQTDNSPRFWTKDMNFAIDILFLDKNMKVLQISENLQPCSSNSCPIYPGPQNTRYALELNSFTAKNQNIQVSDNLKLTNTLQIYNKTYQL